MMTEDEHKLKIVIAFTQGTNSKLKLGKVTGDYLDTQAH